MAVNITEWGLRSYLRFITWRNGELVGTDSTGNQYYIGRKNRGTRREKRWVVYKGPSEASAIPAEWHGWLHHQTNALPRPDSPWRQSWVIDHSPNLTGTTLAYKPPGAIDRGGVRSRATGDYQAWVPGGDAPGPDTPARTTTREDGRLKDAGDVLGDSRDPAAAR